MQGESERDDLCPNCCYLFASRAEADFVCGCPCLLFPLWLFTSWLWRRHKTRTS